MIRERPGEPVPSGDIFAFESMCEEAGGDFQYDPENEIGECDFGDHSIIVHDYLPEHGHGSVVVHQEEGTDWTGSMENFRYNNVTETFILEEADGNPGPPGPMHVDDATVRISDYYVDAERIQQL